MTVAEVLAAARAAHTLYREAVIAKDAIAAGVALVQAQQHRLQAQSIDPERADPAWAAEAATHPHDALLAFYAEQLA